jgi:hypothetical protein
MKKILFTLLLTVKLLQSNAQELKLPEASPAASFTQTLGFTEVTVKYSRPLVRGRKIFGDLVPLDKMWRTGASDCTTIQFNEEMTIGEYICKAGRYAIFTIPSANEWTVIINADTTLHGTTGYDEKKDLHRFMVKPTTTAKFYESFTAEINDITALHNATLYFSWENTSIGIPLKSNADAKLLAEIQENIVKNNTNSAAFIFQSANYYYNTRRELPQALAWSLKAESIDSTNFFYANLTSKIAAEIRDYPTAIAAAKRAIPLGEKKKMTNSVKGLQEKIVLWETLGPTGGIKPMRHVTPTTQEEVKKEVKKIKKVKKNEAFYECPMKCEPPTNSAGKCSKCGMDLVKIKK